MSVPGEVLGWIVLVGIAAAYVPQILAILRGGTQGLSASYVILTAVTGLLMVVATTFAENMRVISCCQVPAWNAHQCVDNLLPLLQFSLACLMQCIVLAVFLLKQADSTKAARMGAGALLLAIVALFSIGGLIHRFGTAAELEIFTSICSVATIIVGVILFAPQYYMNYTMKSSGSLSLLTLAFQTFGLVVFIADNMYEDIQDYPSWGAQIIQFVFTAGLLGLCFYYDFVNPWLERRRRRMAGSGHGFGLEEAFDDIGGTDTEMQVATNLLDDDFLDDDFET